MFNIFKKKGEANFRFNEPKNTACFTCDHVLNNERPILFAFHGSEGEWQFLCRDNHSEANAKIISLKEATELDPTINDLFEMPLGVGAQRATAKDKWTPFKLQD
ncbi:MAG: hypothetical protein ABI723_24670 [Bacteroidia bacterium]